MQVSSCISCNTVMVVLLVAQVLIAVVVIAVVVVAVVVVIVAIVCSYPCDSRVANLPAVLFWRVKHYKQYHFTWLGLADCAER